MRKTEPCIDIRPDHLAIVRAVLRTHVPDRRVLAFGSRATWTAKQYSDLDLAILGDEPLSLNTSSALAEAFGEADLPFKVEFVDWTSIEKSFREIVDRDGVPLHVPEIYPTAADPMTSSAVLDWPTATIEAISEKVAMGPFGSSIKVATFVPDGVPIISGQHLHGARLNDTPGYNFITEDHARRLANANVRRGDIVFTHRGTIGQASYIPDWSRFSRYVVSHSQFYMRCDHSKANPEFVAYYFRSPEGQFKLLASASQVGVPSIEQPVTYLRTIEIPLPPLPEQRAIARILGKLDDKIELNRRMNDTLESIARAIFKDWFVEFGPIRTKADGQSPYLPAELWDLFPDALDGEGNPVGWQRGTLADIADSPVRGVSPTDIPENIPYIGLEHMPRRSIALSEWGRAGSVKSSKSIFEHRDFQFGKLRPYFHKVGVAPLDGICSTDIVVVIPRKLEWYAFTLACLSSDEFVDFTNQTSTGTKMPHTSWNTMRQYEIYIPSVQIVCAFQDLVRPFLDLACANIHESYTLVQTRDLLLPKLISGEIRLYDAEQAAEAVL